MGNVIYALQIDEHTGRFPTTSEIIPREFGGGSGLEKPWNPVQVSLGTFVNSILMEKYFVLQIEEVLNDILCTRQCFQALQTMYDNGIIYHSLILQRQEWGSVAE